MVEPVSATCQFAAPPFARVVLIKAGLCEIQGLMLGGEPTGWPESL